MLPLHRDVEKYGIKKREGAFEMKFKMRMITTVTAGLVLAVVLVVVYMQRERVHVVEKVPEPGKPTLVAKELSYIQSVILPDTEEDILVMLEKAPTAAGEFDVMAFAASLSGELVKSFSQTDKRPLPMAAHWNTGHVAGTNGFSPDIMLSMLEKGSVVLPSWQLEPYWEQNIPESYYGDSIRRAAELKLPLIFVMDPFENALIGDSAYLNLSAEESPYTLNVNGELVEPLSPFASDEVWEEVGINWANSAVLQRIQELYPNPPLVMFVTNKHAPKLGWADVEQSKRYMERYGSGRDDNFKRTLVGARWIEKFRRLEQGFKNSFLSESWKTNSKLLGYDSLPAQMGALNDWQKSALLTQNYVSVWPHTEDGTSLEFHLGDWTQRDNSMLSPHVRANNLPFMLAESQKAKGHYAWHLSITDAQNLSEARRYRGFVQMALWLLRPSVIREQTGWTNDANETLPYFHEIIDSVELIHNNGVFQQFWTKGKLVANTASNHPFGQMIPEEYKDESRWFLLDVNANPPRPWKADSEIRVWAIAYEIGEADAKQWMLYVQSPAEDIEDVMVTIPEYGDVSVKALVNGAFYLVEEVGPTPIKESGIFASRIVYENGDAAANVLVSAIGDGWSRSDYTDENGAFEIRVVADSMFELQADNGEYVAKYSSLLGPVASGESLSNVR